MVTSITSGRLVVFKKNLLLHIHVIVVEELNPPLFDVTYYEDLRSMIWRRVFNSENFIE